MLAAEYEGSLKKQVWALIILNALDGILTFIGLSLGVIAEKNPLLSPLSPFAILTVKLLLSLCLFGLLFTPFVWIRSRLWRISLMAVNTVYFLVFLIHLYWLFLLLI